MGLVLFPVTSLSNEQLIMIRMPGKSSKENSPWSGFSWSYQVEVYAPLSFESASLTFFYLCSPM